MTTAELLERDFSSHELAHLSAHDMLITCWKEKGIAIVEYIDTLNDFRIKPMDDFLVHCTPCGGDWGAMILTGIKELYPTIWELIPDDMGVFAFAVLSDLLELLGYYAD